MPLRRAPIDRERVELATLANGIRDVLGLVPLYVFDSSGRSREWCVGMSYVFYPSLDLTEEGVEG